MERILINKPDIATVEPMLNSADLLVIQCVVEGWTDREVSLLGVDADKAKERIAEKMQRDDSLDRFLASVESLPFTSKNLFSPRESMVSFLMDADFEQRQISKMLRINRGAVNNYALRLEKKKERQGDRDVPGVGLLKDHSLRVGLTRGIYIALRDDQINKETLEVEPKAMLSYNESRVLFLMCAGMSTRDIASLLGNSSEVTIKTFIRRARQKLGVSKTYAMVAKGLVEMMRVQETV